MNNSIRSVNKTKLKVAEKEKLIKKEGACSSTLAANYGPYNSRKFRDRDLSEESPHMHFYLFSS